MSLRLTYLLFALAILAGCQSDGANWNRTSNEVIVRLPSEPGGLNPVMSIADTYARIVFRLMMPPLMDMDPVTKVYSPYLVKTRPQLEPITEGPYAGGVRYTFEMREEAKWDNGQPVLASDYIFTLKTVFNPKVPAQRIRPYLELVADVETYPDNPRKFSVVAKEPYILAEEAISASLPVLPEYLYDPDGLLKDYSLKDMLDPSKVEAMMQDSNLQAFSDQFTSEKYNRQKEYLLGCGPYAFEEWESGQRITLVKKAGWWGDALTAESPLFRAYPERIVFKPVREPAAALAQVQAEEVDITYYLEAKDFVALQQNPTVAATYNFYSPMSQSLFFVYINCRNEKLNDPRVRRALAHLYDVDAVIKTVFSGMGERLAGPFIPSKDYYRSDLPLIPLDIEKAKILLSEAGWTDTNGNGTVDKTIGGVKVEMKLSFLISNEIQEQMALIFQQSAAQAGVEIEIVLKEFQAQRADLNSRNFELSSGALVSQPLLDDPYQIWHTSSDTPDGTNRMGFGNANSDEVIEAIRRTLDKDTRDALYRTFQQMVYDDQPVIFLFVPKGRIMIHKRFDSYASEALPGFFPEQYPLNQDN